MENLDTQKLRVAMILPSLDHKGPIILARNITKALNHVVDFEMFYFDPIVAMQFEVKTTQISFFHQPDFTKFDLIHCHMLRPDLYVVWHKLYKKKTLVSTLHQYIDDVLLHSYNKPIQCFFGNLWKFALSRMDAVVCINSDQTEFYSKEKLNNHVLTIHNGVEDGEEVQVPELERISEIKRNFTLIGSLAIIRKIKGIEQTFLLLSKNPHLFYLHIGNGEDEAYYVALAKEMGVENRVWFLGYKENPKSYLKLLDLYVATSRSEGFGMALVEAVVARVPVACTKIPSFMEMFA
jgi:glycosyltransferase involved in cell wall biosynthesis